MGSLSEDDECPFFDASEDIALISGSSSDGNERFDSYYWFSNDVWIRSPTSVKERRSKFLDWMEVSLDSLSGDKLVGVSSLEREVDRISKSSGAVLRTPGYHEELSLIRSNDNVDLLVDCFVCRDGNLDGGMVCDVDEMVQDGKMSDDLEIGLEITSKSLPLLDENVVEESSPVGMRKGVKRGWLSRLRSLACVVDKQGESEKLKPNEFDAILWPRVQRMKVHQSKKQSKELSALFKGQEIQAHEGSILTMKFSSDGKYLASAGEDGVVRLWQVVEDERITELDIPEIDPSFIYFTVNHLSELKPLYMDKEKISILRSLRKTSESACIIFPPKVFRILEKPLHEFHGHSGEILDLSWSKKNYLLSASIDNSVRLWRVGSDHCLGVFLHKNYVTCVNFNPIDDNYFISGSIDGKVRIWAIPCCKVVDWADVRDIVTAVCYRPDGQGGIIGCITGNCRFYNISGMPFTLSVNRFLARRYDHNFNMDKLKKKKFAGKIFSSLSVDYHDFVVSDQRVFVLLGLDNHLQLDAEICLHSKKKALGKRVIAFQFFPEDSRKVMVACADSQIRILQGPNVIGKYRGRSAGNHLSASFTSDGKHIVSACEDSNVYIWNCTGQEEPALNQAKTVSSWERFTTNASVAIPWCGFKGNSDNYRQCHISDDDSPENLSFAPASFSLGEEYYLESFPKGSATWPEEKLPALSQLSPGSTMDKSQCKFLKSSCQCTSSSHAWGLVVVTAGWDGRIRSFHNYGLPIPV